MVLPLFALGLLTAGTGIAKGFYDETQEQKRLREAMAALQGATRENIGATLNPSVANELAGTRNPILGRATPELAANPRSAPDAQTAARLRLTNAYAQINPEKALEMAQSMAKPKAPIAVPKDTVLLNPDTMKPEFDNRTPDRPSNPSMLSIYNRNGDPVATINQNDPAALARYEPLLANGTYTTVKPDKNNDGLWTPMSADEIKAANLPDGFTYQRHSKTGQIQKITEPKQDKPSETENRFGYHATRITNEMERLKSIIEKGGTDAVTSASDYVGGAYILRGATEKQAENAYTGIVDSLLNIATGAAYTQEQLESTIKEIKPLPYDDKDTLQQKAERLQGLVTAAKKAARAAGQEIEIPDLTSMFGTEQGGVSTNINQWKAGETRNILGVRVTRQ